jgi:hypothetical protein
MGNVLELPTEGDPAVVELKDKELFDLPSSSVFNDEYVASVYESLPKLDDEVVDDETDKGETGKSEVDAGMLRMISILVNNRAQISSELDTFKVRCATFVF